MANTVSVPIAVGGAVVAVVVVLGGIFLLSGEPESRAGQQAGPAPTTRLTFPDTSPSGTDSDSDSPHPPVPDEQVDGDLATSARTEGRTLYVPVREGDCTREEIWPRGEHPDRVEIEIRSIPLPMTTGVTTRADGTTEYGCFGSIGPDGAYAVIELAEPLGDRRLVVKNVFSPTPS